jgi:tRNA(Ile)-lysidine synthetase-like protein
LANAQATVERALRAARARLPDLFSPGTRLVVGFSGGQDSTCLLHALRQYDVELIAAHVDHSLRPDSAADAERVVALAERIGVASEVTRVDVGAYRVRRSVQHAARAARYQALAAVVERVGGAALLVAHTADDQAETILLNLVRGTGLQGLAGMRLDETLDLGQLGPPVPGLSGTPAAVRLARPLLKVERSTTMAYCTGFGLALVEDASNLSRVFTRNRVRLDMVPVLERFNPAIRQVLARTADLVGDDLAVLDSVVGELHAMLVHQPAPDVLSYDVRAWRAQPRGLQRRLLRRGLECLLGTLEDVPAAPIEDALDLLRSSRGGQAYHLPYGVELVCQENDFELRRHGAAQARRVNTQVRDLPRV